MANLKEIRNRIASVTSTRQITSAMKMVSAAKLRKAQQAIQQIRPYADKLHDIMQNLNSGLDSSDLENIFAEQREVKNVLLVVISSNRGLCGAFNSNAVKIALSIAKSKYEKIYKVGNVKFLFIGKKAMENIVKKEKSLGEYNEIFNNLEYNGAAAIAENLLNLYKEGKFDRIELIYNEFVNTATQRITSEQYLPLQLPQAGNKHFSTDYIYEPSKEYIISELIPKSLKFQFYKALLDSYAAEHGARMTAMHKATDNASEMINELKLKYNKARQASITNEILEIVGGAEALRG